MITLHFLPSFRAAGLAPLLRHFPECVMNNKLPSYLSNVQIIVEKPLYNNGDVSVYLGTCQDLAKTKVAIKFSLICRLLPERAVYDELEALQGDCIPKLYGMFFGESILDREIACIVLEYGEPIQGALYALPYKDKSVPLISLCNSNYAYHDITQSRNFVAPCSCSFPWLQTSRLRRAQYHQSRERLSAYRLRGCCRTQGMPVVGRLSQSRRTRLLW